MKARLTLAAVLLLLFGIACAENDPALVGTWNQSSDSRYTFFEDGTFVYAVDTNDFGVQEQCGPWVTEDGSLTLTMPRGDTVYAYVLRNGRLRLTSTLGVTKTWQRVEEPALTDAEAALVGVWAVTGENAPLFRDNPYMEEFFFQFNPDGSGLTAYTFVPSSAPETVEPHQYSRITWRLRDSALDIVGYAFPFNPGSLTVRFTVEVEDGKMTLSDSAGHVVTLERRALNLLAALTEEEAALCGTWYAETRVFFGPVYPESHDPQADTPGCLIMLNPDRTCARRVVYPNGASEVWIPEVSWWVRNGQLFVGSAYGITEIHDFALTGDILTLIFSGAEYPKGLSDIILTRYTN